MGLKSALYDLLKLSNDVNAVYKAVSKGSTKPITRRIGRRAYGKGTGKLARKIFG